MQAYRLSLGQEVNQSTEIELLIFPGESSRLPRRGIEWYANRHRRLVDRCIDSNPDCILIQIDCTNVGPTYCSIQIGC